jgi:hypothetical protein
MTNHQFTMKIFLLSRNDIQQQPTALDPTYSLATLFMLLEQLTECTRQLLQE